MIGPLFWPALALLAGILVGDFLGGSPTGWLAGMTFAALLALALALWRRRRIAPQPAGTLNFASPTIPSLVLVPFSLAALCLGAALDRRATPTVDPAYIGWYVGRQAPAAVEGLLVYPPDERDRYTNLLLEVAAIQLVEAGPWQPVSGRLLASVSPGGGWRYGDRLRLAGEIGFPEDTEDSSYPAYLYRHAVGAT